jgi:nucleoside-triphosphatase THEP1
MTLPQPKLILWVGPKHSGKTTALADLVERARADGFRVAGVLAPAVYDGDTLAGFDVVDAATGARCALARRDEQGAVRSGSFSFAAEGLERGHAALMSDSAREADLLIVDEFGSLELRGQGWRADVDRLLPSAAGLILLVVRDGLAEPVKRLCAPWHPHTLRACQEGAARSVLALLGEQAGCSEGTRG